MNDTVENVTDVLNHDNSLGIFYQIGYLPSAILGREAVGIQQIFYRVLNEVFGFGYNPVTGKHFNFGLGDLVPAPEPTYNEQGERV